MIPGITDKQRLPRIAKIRLGEKATSASGKEHPAALDHFSFKDCPELAHVYGENCKELYPVLLPHDDEDVWFPTARKAYTASRLFCACSDGMTATRTLTANDKQGIEHLESNWEKVSKPGSKLEFVNGETGESVIEGDMFEMPCPGEVCPLFADGKCQNVGRLFIVLPNAPIFGVYEIATTSKNGIRDVLDYARRVKSESGTLAGIPFSLKLVPQKAQVAGSFKTIHVLKLEYRGGLQALWKIRKSLAAGVPALPTLDVGEEVPDDLMPFAGAGLGADLGENQRPPKNEAEALKQRLSKGNDAPETLTDPRLI